MGVLFIINEPEHDKTNGMAGAPSEDAVQTGRMSMLI